MYNDAIKILEELNNNGYEAYIVGGYPRDRYLGISSKDIDICTSATPTDIESIFSIVDMSNSSYGSVRLLYNSFTYEITTFRRDKAMLDGNRSYSVEYVDTLKEDLLRRDFVINTLCIDKYGRYVDYLGAIKDMDDKVIRTIQEPSISFKEDPLRILRAIRFSTTLSFSLSEDICFCLTSEREYLSKLSLYHCKKELDLIFSNPNCMVGILNLKKYGIDEVLSIDFKDVKFCSNYLGIWAQCSWDEGYSFTAKEKEFIYKIRSVLSLEPTFLTLYKYGMEVCGIVDEINENQVYYELFKTIPIHKREDINIDKKFLLTNVPHNLISTIYEKLEYEILNCNLDNEQSKIEQYILENI